MGIVIHSTRGGAAWGREYDGTLNWFRNPSSQVSAHVVLGRDGRRARCVPHHLIAWHAGEHNADHLGVELEQPRAGDPISDLQYAALRAWVAEMEAVYGPLRLVEHKDTKQGRAAGKSDVGPPFSIARVRQ